MVAMWLGAVFISILELEEGFAVLEEVREGATESASPELYSVFR
jgi:hypothetical protein